MKIPASIKSGKFLDQLNDYALPETSSRLRHTFNRWHYVIAEEESPSLNDISGMANVVPILCLK
jgi:hypothetical protein